MKIIDFAFVSAMESENREKLRINFCRIKKMMEGASLALRRCVH